jgi:hypothetical protein
MKSRYLTVALAAIILASLYFDATLYLQTQSQTQPYDAKKTDDYKLYGNEFGVSPTLQQNYTFWTPVSMYRALRIALESDGWNRTSLQGMKIQVSFDYIRFTNTRFSSGMQVLQSGVTEPIGNVSAVQIGSNAYRYIWSIYVSNATANMHPYAIYYVDAATAQIIPHGPIY